MTGKSRHASTPNQPDRWTLRVARSWVLHDFDDLQQAYLEYFEFKDAHIYHALSWARRTIHLHGGPIDLHADKIHEHIRDGYR